MSAIITRLLLLGGVRLFEPINGYQLRRELLSWGVDEWAHVNPGSIYTGLATLTKQQHVRRYEVAEANRTVAVYTTTAAGQAEFHRLFEQAMISYDSASLSGMYVAMSFASLVSRARVLELLKRRRQILEDVAPRAEEKTAIDPARIPPNVPFIQALVRGQVGSEYGWLLDTILKIEAGEGAFAEDPTWTPPDDDPGWQITQERERYRTLLQL